LPYDKLDNHFQIVMSQSFSQVNHKNQLASRAQQEQQPLVSHITFNNCV